ncbi:ras-related protein Rab-22A-like [Watersipora subatra]|uniref:ras-related protein Rab-22A-like n=1 Tax=Watersipora subatra TaxID=2589382 RepID=UPI00355BF03C
MTMREIKLCLLGDTNVGKTSVVQRFVMDSFKPGTETTIGASFMSKTLLVDDKSYRYQIWDTAGQEKYRALAPMYYRGSAAAIIMYDITNEESFRGVKSWIKELREKGPKSIVLAIAGNKIDLEDQREVSTEEAADYCSQVGAIFIETSALTAAGVNQLFTDISERLPGQSLAVHSNSATIQLRKTETSKKKSCSC